MRRRLARLIAVPALLATAPLHAQYGPASGNPALIVFVTVDQMRPDYLDIFARQLTGGLARLSQRGAFYTNAFQDHGITETAPGHASTMSGRFPRSTGIVMNLAGVNDPEAHLIGAAGEGASPFRFRGTTLADWLRFANPRSRSLSVSRKDRGAILPLGRAKGEAFWYAGNGTFTTSSWYADTLPGWVKAFNDRHLPQQWAGKTWNLLLPDSAYAEPDSIPIESTGVDFVFPHQFPADPATTAAVFANYPMMDDVTLQLALAGLSARELGASPNRTDILAVSLSTTDAVGHRFGPDSRELHDQILRLDRYLGAFLDSLFKLRDPATIVIALTADHGVAPYPNGEVQSRFRNQPGGFVELTPLVRALFQGLAAAKVDTTGYDWDPGVLYLDPQVLARAHVNRDSVARLFAAAAAKVDGVERADVVSELARRDTTKDAIARRWLHMFPPDVPAAVVVTQKPFWYWNGVRIATHGSPNDYDAHVPLILYGPMIKPGRYAVMARVVDLAPTLAQIVGVRPMERLDGHVLREALR
jgi:predicted AlkP superfamily pyrophosphatase or phosphodiesterase